MMFNILTLLTFFLFSLGQLGRISLQNQQVNVYLYEVAMFLLLLFLFIKYRLKPLASGFTRWKEGYYLIGAMLLSNIFNINAFNNQQNLVAWLYFMRLIGYFIYFIYLFFAIKEKPTQVKKTLRNGLLIFILITIVSSIIQYFLYPNLRNLSYQGWDPHQYRLFGVFFDTSIIGALYGLIFLFLFFEQLAIKKYHWLAYILKGSYLVFLIASFARNVYLGIILTLGIYFLAKVKWRSLVVFLAIFVIVLFIIPKPFGEGIKLTRQFSLLGRLSDYEVGVKLWIQKPFFGFGYNHIRYLKEQINLNDFQGLETSHAGASFHSSYLVMLVTSGVTGLILLLAFMHKLAGLSGNARHYLLFVGIVSMFDNVLLHPFILFILFSMLTLSFTLSHKLRL